MAVLLCALTAMAAHAVEQVAVCFNYGCSSQQTVEFSEPELDALRGLLGLADSAEQERIILALVIGRMYWRAGQQTPVVADRGGNFADEGQPGSMDCIDHSTTTTGFLRILERRTMLHFHRVLEPVRRGVVWQHLSAQIEELGKGLMPAETENSGRYAVDSWYVDNGRPAIVMPVDEWKDGGGPDV